MRHATWQKATSDDTKKLQGYLLQRVQNDKFCRRIFRLGYVGQTGDSDLQGRQPQNTYSLQWPSWSYNCSDVIQDECIERKTSIFTGITASEIEQNPRETLLTTRTLIGRSTKDRYMTYEQALADFLCRHWSDKLRDLTSPNCFIRDELFRCRPSFAIELLRKVESHPSMFRTW